MNKISWCKKQEKGIKLVEPNDNLSMEYYQNAEESLKVLRSIYGTRSNMWLATTKYYIEYFAVYSILMKLGIKCEIHDCTIALTKFLEDEDIIEKGITKILWDDKELRIDNQYYLKNKPVNIDGYRNSRLFLTYSIPFGLIKSNLNFTSGFVYNRIPALINQQQNLADNYNFSEGISVSSNISENIDFNISYITNYTIAKNSLQTGADQDYFYHNFSFNLNILIHPLGNKF